MRKISTLRGRSRRIAFRGALRWALYSAVLVIFYLAMSNPLIRGWCPMLIIPLATSVSLFEGDLSAGIFGACCGLMMDMASGSSPAGFYALWLLCACPCISLLSRFWIKVNFISHFVINAAVSVVMAAMDMIFLHWVWEGAQSGISFVRIILPSYGGAVLFSVPVYFLVGFIIKKLRPDSAKRLAVSAENAENAENIEKI